MKHTYKQSGFSAVELLITLFIAAAFLISGFQLYSFVVKDGGEARFQAKASNVAAEYLQKYKSGVKNNPCIEYILETNSPINPDGLPSTSLSANVSCPYGTSSSVSKVTVEIKYGNPQQTIVNSTFVKPACLTNYIEVPGSKTYGTNDFCVMKYEAKDVGGVATSQPELQPWVSISQTNASTAASAACSGCHLITEAEWMTIAQNVLSVPSNWSGGEIGSGYIYSGHNDNSPANSLAANTNDENGYSGTGNSESDNTVTNGMIGKSQRRTLTLTNGEVIWDFAGNVWEWTSGQTTGGQPGITGELGYAYKEWNATPMTNGTLAVNPFPANTGINGANTWNAASNGIGKLHSYVGETGLRAMLRGGSWSNTVDAGIMTLALNFGPSSEIITTGFRVAQ